MMKALLKLGSREMMILCLLWAGLMFSGCQTEPREFMPPPKGIDSPRQQQSRGEKFAAGDMVTLMFSGVTETGPLQSYQDTVKDDGRISPPVVGAWMAAGKTPGELQRELQTEYERYYKNLRVSVIPRERYYYVSGEVRRPGPQQYLGPTDIVKAIAAAGDFTDFADKKAVRLTRVDGRTEIVNVKEVLQNSGLDVPVYPGDKIWVDRSIF